MSTLEGFIEWEFIYKIYNSLYFNIGLERVNPMFINIIFDIPSMRRTCQEAKGNVAYKCFL